ncbi:MAG: pyruvate, phosphate dikinase [Candidatus Goldbacteria bacterium]|nr:pyruvate, phosphate dikinase [Candidatus Goldiibacteriota bacterium]
MAKAKKSAAKKPAGKAKKYVYFFGNGKADGEGHQKALLGGKGAGLAEMTKAGVPVPPGFTITTEVCNLYYEVGRKIPDAVEKEMLMHVDKLEKSTGKKFGGENPLLVSVRSGAKFSMPGMMDTILNLGLNDNSVLSLIKQTKNERFAYDSYRRFIMMFSDVAMDVPKNKFEHLFEEAKHKKGVKLDTELDSKDLREICERFKELFKKEKGMDFPQDPLEQLRLARNAVFNSWMNDRAIYYRKQNDIPHDLGTAVNVQSMVFGNMGNDSGTGVGFTRNPATGENVFYGEYLINAQGEDVVAGVRTPQPIASLEKDMPEVYKQLRQITSKLEKHYRDIQDFEFTIEKGKLFMLQTRSGKRTAKAAVRIAVEMVGEKLISKEEAVLRVSPASLDQLLHPVFDPKAELQIIAKGLPASPGAATGKAVFTANEAVEWDEKGEHTILVRQETCPDDIHGMDAANGILTARGGMTSHAAVVARSMGKCCVAGCEDIKVDEHSKTMTTKSGLVIKEGDWISIDGSTGKVIKGKVPTVEPKLEGEFGTFMKWADAYRTLTVRANADVPRDGKVAREFGAEGIGLCRTEHMFFDADRLPHMQAMILATDEAGRRKALEKLLPMQRSDFKGLFESMEGFGVTVRLLDPPLHEFLPKREELMVDIAKAEASGKTTIESEGLKKALELIKTNGTELEKAKMLLSRVEELHEFNPMLGHRGCRLGITYPEITEMQATAIFEAAAELIKAGKKVVPEVMVPLVGNVKEFKDQKVIIDNMAKKVIKEKGVKMQYMVGTMIEVPRAAVTADKIAAEAEFFSFGTNDLTQTALGFSRDDAGKFTKAYIDKFIFEKDPFQTLDQDGVGLLMIDAVTKGKATRPGIKLGICGEHGGDPASVEFCHKIGLSYVSCSPYRVPIARLAAAQAGINFPAKKAAAKKTAKKK